MCRQSGQGFSLLELLLVISLFGVQAGMTSLQLAPLLNRTALNNGVRQIVSDLQLVRMQAIARNRRLRVTFQPGTNRYVVEKERTGDGWDITSTVMAMEETTGCIYACQRRLSSLRRIREAM